jgi:GntR family transcriptional regulator
MRIVIAGSSSVPLYEQIAEQLRAHVVSGALAPEELLPSIRTFARDLGVSIITVKRAYEDLEAEGFVESRQGQGTFVASLGEELLKDRRRRVVEERLGEAVREAKAMGVAGRELGEMLALLLKEEGL